MEDSADAENTAEQPQFGGAREAGGFGLLALAVGLPLSVLKRWPLAVGAVLLVAFSAVSNAASWGSPSFIVADGLGGPDVEIVIIEGAPQTQEEEEYYVRGAPPFFEFTQLTELVLAEYGEVGLVTVPWTPVLPEGASGHGVKTYVVETGDTLGWIAEQYDVSTLALAYSNNIVDPDSIQPGDKLRVPPVEGVLHVVKKNETLNGIAKKYDADTAEILAYNGLPADGSVLNVGDELVVPGGTPPPPPKPKYVPTYSGPSYAKSTVALGYFIAPTTGHNYGRRHSNNGVDIANSCGTPVYAAAAGTITRADGIGWNGGYGKVIEIVHGNGTETRYAHLSSILVASGSVGKGQLIGLIGSTGRSTGCHLHFEVHGARNPLVR